MVVCHACGKEIDLGLGGSAGRRDECPHCRAPLHACRNCAAYDETARYGCRDFRSIGHKAIYVANAWRTLNTVGWQ